VRPVSLMGEGHLSAETISDLDIEVPVHRQHSAATDAAVTQASSHFAASQTSSSIDTLTSSLIGLLLSPRDAAEYVRNSMMTSHKRSKRQIKFKFTSRRKKRISQ
jgi:hypothetical protein